MKRIIGILRLSLIVSLIVFFLAIISFFLFGPKFVDKTLIEYDYNYNNSIPVEFKVAFVGDQGHNDNSTAVLRMIKEENTDMVLHSGDFDYNDDPAAWDKQIDDILGEDFPYFASIGNHELKIWPQYQKKLAARLERIDGAKCVGDLGVASACEYKGLFFVLSGVGTKGYWYDTSKLPFYAPWRFPFKFLAMPSQFLHTSYIKNQLDNSDSLWKICSWHKNQELMQVGFKVDEVGWQAYEECRKAGAIITTGHQHSYSRTHLVSNFVTQQVASKSNVLQIRKGRTFAFVSGISGKSIHPQNDELAGKDWWALVYTARQDANHGALFCIFNENGTENMAHCYFKDINGRIADEFGIINDVR